MPVINPGCWPTLISSYLRESVKFESVSAWDDLLLWSFVTSWLRRHWCDRVSCDRVGLYIGVIVLVFFIGVTVLVFFIGVTVLVFFIGVTVLVFFIGVTMLVLTVLVFFIGVTVLVFLIATVKRCPNTWMKHFLTSLLYNWWNIYFMKTSISRIANTRKSVSHCLISWEFYIGLFVFKN